MARCARYFSGIVNGEALDHFEVAAGGAADVEERKAAEAALEKAAEIYASALASIRAALGAYADVWVESARRILDAAAAGPTAQELLPLRLDKPVAEPAALQAIARDLFAAPEPSAEGARQAGFFFDAQVAENAAPREQPHLPASVVGALRAATYPFIALKPRFMDGADLFDPSKDVRLSAYFGADLTRPDLFGAKLVAGLVRLLRPAAAGDPTRVHSEPPRVFVGQSLTHIPLAYAATDHEISGALADAYDRSALPAAAAARAIQAGLVDAGLLETSPETAARWAKRYRARALRQVRSDLKYVFPFPDLSEIDDRYVDGDYRTKIIDASRFSLMPSAVLAEIAAIRESFRAAWKALSRDDARIGPRAPLQDVAQPAAREIAKPLTQFGAKRVDYALSRLEHYTGTQVEHFQPYVFFTNYPFYMQAFIAETFSQHVAHGHGRLVAPLDPGAPSAAPQRVKETEIGRTPPRFLTRPKDPSAPDGPRVFDPAKATRFEPKQMPAVHFIPDIADLPGMTIVNIGVGPSNAKTMTDILAVLDANAWLMLGHCGGLRRTQEIGQFVLAQAYVRDDKVLDDALPHWAPIPQMIEVQECLLRAIEEVLLEEDANPETGDQRFIAYTRYKAEIMALLDALGVAIPDPTRLSFGAEGAGGPTSRAALAEHPILKAAKLALAPDESGALAAIDPERAKRVEAAYRAWRREARLRARTGTVVSTDNRNWELNAHEEVISRLGRSKAIAIDMESATIAGAGLRYRVPYGTLLCVSDKPMMGEPKMRGQADEFYETATRNHVRIGLRTVEHLYERREEIARSRKLNGLDDPPLG